MTILFVMSFALDAKGAVGGSPLQFLMAGINSIAFLSLAISNRMALPRKGFSAKVFLAWGSFLAIGTLGAILHSVPFGHYVRITYTFMLFLQGFLVVWWTARHSGEVEVVVSAMMATAVVSLFFTLGWGFYFSGESPEQIRYQILSPLIPLILVVTGFDLVIAKRQRLWSLFLITATLGIIALSVTRSMILVAGFVVGIVALAALWNAIHTGRLPRWILRVVVWGGVFLPLGIAAAIMFNPDVLVRWDHRSFGAVHNVTFWTRVAAVIGQIQVLESNPLSWVTGQGFGRTYPWPIHLFPWIVPYLGQRSPASAWFPGEFMWMSFLFYGGLILGTLAALLLLVGAVRAFHSLAILLSTQSWRIPQARPLWVGALGYFAFIGMGFAANPFVLRLAALYMGLCFGLVVAQGRWFYSYSLDGFKNLWRARE